MCTECGATYGCIRPVVSSKDDNLPPNYRPSVRFLKLMDRRTDEENKVLRRELGGLDIELSSSLGCLDGSVD